MVTLRSLKFSLIVMGLLAGANTACLAASQDRNLLILGDSISAAYGMQLEQGWVSLLELELADKFPTITVINASISGETSDGVRRRLPQLLDAHKPRWVVVEIGGNDGLRGFPIPRLRANIKEIIEHTIHGDTEVLLLGMKIPPNYGSKYTEAFSALYRDLAAEFNLSLLPFFLEGIAGNDELMQADGIHPTVGAQAMLVENIKPRLFDMLIGSSTVQVETP
ncbi:MAG: acyl-CoA thioesterase-1 [Halieaceae bacterium]|jgi:acyl-CoA thioesterase-1